MNKLWSEVVDKATVSGSAPELTKDRNGRGLGRLAEWFQPQAIRRYAVAAVLLVACSLVYYGSQEVTTVSGNTSAEWVALAVESGSHDEIIMSDGTRVRLDAGSTLRYPEIFDDGERTVSLSGEGYFEVAPVGKPFVVHADGALVEVLGTQFNVRAWQPEQRVVVAVAEGRVSLGSGGRSRDAVEIAGGQMSTLAHGGVPAAPRDVDIRQQLGWMQREAFFDNTPLHEILYQLERWYDVEFTLEDETMADEQLTIHVPAQPLEDVLELISALTGLEYQRPEGSVSLKPRDSIQ